MSEPVIPENTIAALENLSRRFQMQADQAQATADEMQSAAKLVNESMKRARELNRPVNVPVESVRNGSEKATWKTKGAIAILECLAQFGPFDSMQITEKTTLAPSTLRTYLPILTRDGLAMYDNIEGDYSITDAGRAALLS